MKLRTIEEAAQELHTSRSSLYRMFNRGDGPRAIKVGGKTLIPADELSRWLASRPNPFEKVSDAA